MGFEEKEPFLRTPISNPARVPGCQVGARPSPPEAELGDDRPVPVDVSPLQIVQKAAPLADQLEQPAPRVVIMGMRFQMVGEVIDPFAEDCDLDLG